jgi:hypothetical protein
MGLSSDGNHPQIIAIFGLGTLGDILPLLILAKFLLEQSFEAKEASVEIIFITQIFHDATVQSFFPMDAYSSNYNNKFSVTYVHSHPIGLNRNDRDKNKGDIDSEKNTNERDSFYSLEELDLICVQIASIDALRLVIANLFCLVGFLVAEKKGIRCLFLHPHKPPSRKPADYQSALKRGAPTFYQQLFQKQSLSTNCKNYQLVSLNFLVNQQGSYHTTRNLSDWQDYDEWLWPLLSPMYDSTRDALHLSHFTSIDYILPLAPMVLLTVSPHYFPPPGYWPVDKYSVIGYMQYQNTEKIKQMFDNNDKHSGNNHIRNEAEIVDTVHLNSHDVSHTSNSILPEIVQQFISCQNDNTICIDFGSMTELIIHEYSLGIFCCTLLNIQNFSFIILCHGYINLFQSYLLKALKILELTENWDCEGNGSCETDMNVKVLKFSEKICLVDKFMDHTILFKKCVGILHHGGVGTLSCCLLVGIPQGKKHFL